MSDSKDKDFLADFLVDVVNEVNDEISQEESEFESFLNDFTDLDKKYSQKEFLARGGMKNIFRVKENQTSRNVAMAQLIGDDINRKKVLAFLREARITALLEHPNIVPIHEINHKDGMPYFTMKEIQGVTLGEILKKLKENSHKFKKKYDLNTLLNIFIKVCDAISYAHSRNIVHLDLKPDNIHVGEFGEVLVIDWGLAKEISETESSSNRTEEFQVDHEHTLDGFVKGTIGFMAPEQARGENSQKDMRTDIYSLGAILYAILSFESPYEEENTKKAISLTALGDYNPLRNEKELPNALVSVTYRALQKHKSDRYQHVEELKDDVQLYLNGFATKAQDASLADIAVLFYKRNKALCTLTAAFVLISIASTYAFIASLTKSEAIAKKNAELAVNNAIEAEKREQEARQLYVDLTNTIKEKEELTTTSIPLVLDKANFMRRRQYNFDESYKILNEVYDEDIKDTEYWIELAYHLVGDFKFEEALKYFTKAHSLTKNKNSRHIQQGLEISKKYIDFKKDIPNLKRLYADIHKLKKPIVTSQVSKNVFMNWGLTQEEQKEVFLFCIKVCNPEVSDWHINIQQSKVQKHKFNIIFDNHKLLADISPLTGLQIDKVSFRGCTSLNSLLCLRACDIRSLDLSQTDANKLKYKQNVYNLMIESVEELIMQNMNLRHLRLIGKQNLKTLDLSGSQVNSQNISNQNVESLNFCQAIVEDQQYLRRFVNLKRIIIPEKNVNKPLIKYWNSKKIKITKCKCTNKRVCQLK
ncbi:MAG: serine/threonine protein kinase [Lentisphaeraceae bacterium]|nr:serine/threonine protein kinase [Lentisphaeraceae bacterium]